jgi:chaperone required for assembly of F1-ATPase
MSDVFEELFRQPPLDPIEAARKGARARQVRRFYKEVAIEKGEHGFALKLDARPVRTPRRRMLAAPREVLAASLAEEWHAQGETIDPATMPLTRLANSIIDGVADEAKAVRAEAEKYLASDLVFYRAEHPDALVACQERAWDPLLDWAREVLGARFVCSAGVMHVAQPQEALAAAYAAFPGEIMGADDAWRLGAFHSITTLTGSALIALAVLHGRLSGEAAWAAANIDEDWNMETWGQDAEAVERRAQRSAEMRAAVLVLDSLREADAN